jgi:hypothetical protein
MTICSVESVMNISKPQTSRALLDRSIKPLNRDKSREQLAIATDNVAGTVDINITVISNSDAENDGNTEELPRFMANNMPASFVLTLLSQAEVDLGRCFDELGDLFDHRDAPLRKLLFMREDMPPACCCPCSLAHNLLLEIKPWKPLN